MIQSEKQQIYFAQIYKLKINNIKNSMFYEAVFILLRFVVIIKKHNKNELKKKCHALKMF